MTVMPLRVRIVLILVSLPSADVPLSFLLQILQGIQASAPQVWEQFEMLLANFNRKLKAIGRENVNEIATSVVICGMLLFLSAFATFFAVQYVMHHASLLSGLLG